MTNDDYKLTRNRARHELQTKLKTRVRLDAEVSENNQRIAELIQAVKALDLLVGDGGETTDLMIAIAGVPLADAVRELLRLSNVHLTALDISRELKRLGFRNTDYTNPQASIHTMLRRLEESGQADTIIKDGKTAYRLLKTEGSYAAPDFSES